jgi:hypothetical protein
MHSDTDNNICDGHECCSRADCTVTVRVAKGRTISLSLCQSCKTKFSAHSSHQGDLDNAAR